MGGLCTPYPTLVYSGATLGDHLHSIDEISPSRMTPVSRQQNYWSNSPLLDGRYPAVIWEYTFTVYQEEADELEFVRGFATMANTGLNDANARSLEVKNSEGIVVAFGDCYYEGQKLTGPDAFLLGAAGLIQLQFVGTQVPSVINSP